MPTIGEVYNPVIEAIREGRPMDAVQALGVAAAGIVRETPERHLTPQQGLNAAKVNCVYYSAYFGEEVQAGVSTFLGPVTWMDIVEVIQAPTTPENATTQVPAERKRHVRIRRDP